MIGEFYDSPEMNLIPETTLPGFVRCGEDCFPVTRCQQRNDIIARRIYSFFEPLQNICYVCIHRLIQCKIDQTYFPAM